MVRLDNMKTATVHAFPKTSTKAATRKTPRKRATRKNPGVVDQVRIACRPENRLPTAMGAVLGGFVPAATFTLAHHAATTASVMGYAVLALVVGGLVFSAKTVWQWGRLAFAGDIWKATGFVLLIEGVMTVPHGLTELAYVALGLLVAINAIATGVVLSRS